jgi:carbonic anhydrase/acetyltransferase-like protein (isoleucine patch superfamily)
VLIEHRGRRPQVHPSAYVAPTAVLSGDVRVGPGCRVLFGAVLTDDGGPVVLGESSIVMETAVLRGTRRDPLELGAHVLVGPRAYLVGATVADDCFLATGATVFNGARLGRGCQVRINGVVHLRTVLPAGTLVPIGWVAVGDPPLIAPPDQHDEIWAVQRELDFPGYVWGLPRLAPDSAGVPGEQMPEIARRFGRLLGGHQDDRVLDDADLERPS